MSQVSATVPTARTAPPAGAGIRRKGSRPALAAGLLAALVVLVLISGVSLAVGSGHVPLADVWHALVSPDDAQRTHVVVRTVRVPRTFAGILAGVALGLAGALMQGVTRNPLADPGLLGVNAGASAAVVLALGVLGITAPAQYIWFGFGGALLAALFVFGVGSIGREGATPVKLALAGASTSALLGSLTTAVLLTDSKSFDQFRFWQVGSLSGRETDALWQVLPFIVAGSLLALALGPQLNALALGDDVARGLGQRVGPARAAAALAVVLLCGSATVIAGPIGFVGLVVPHAARLITGPDHRWVLAYSAVLAPILLLVADIVGRLAARPAEVQVGIVTAVIGCIPFVVLVRRRKLVEL